MAVLSMQSKKKKGESEQKKESEGRKEKRREQKDSGEVKCAQ